ncbi:hypothetical protein HanIR_Chr10g0490071 [Helianthus annuus]|nr:hypothetical protein HanIR_Chr10g0490071 [Helianthus annuus]
MVDQRNTSKLSIEQSKGEFTTFYLKHAFPVVGKRNETTFPGLELLTISLCGMRYSISLCEIRVTTLSPVRDTNLLFSPCAGLLVNYCLYGNAMSNTKRNSIT